MIISSINTERENNNKIVIISNLCELSYEIVHLDFYQKIFEFGSINDKITCIWIKAYRKILGDFNFENTLF